LQQVHITMFFLIKNEKKFTKNKFLFSFSQFPIWLFTRSLSTFSGLQPTTNPPPETAKNSPSFVLVSHSLTFPLCYNDRFFSVSWIILSRYSTNVVFFAKKIILIDALFGLSFCCSPEISKKCRNENEKLSRFPLFFFLIHA
jgi:hypothetical protein